jgi:hypothetical protein
MEQFILITNSNEAATGIAIWELIDGVLGFISSFLGILKDCSSTFF